MSHNIRGFSQSQLAHALNSENRRTPPKMIRLILSAQSPGSYPPLSIDEMVLGDDMM